MKSEYIDVNGHWGIVYCYDLRRLDEYEIRAMLMSFGLRGSRIDDAVDVLLYEKNTGLCVSNEGLRMSLIFIGRATSDEQHWDTVVHELFHAACAICDYYDIEHDGEDFAWTIGYLTRKIVEKTAPPCR